MKSHTRILAAALLASTALASSVLAQSRPGIDRPIRVGMFKGTGTGSRYWHTNIHTSHTVMASILANPAGSNLGPDLAVPPMGFTFHSMSVALNQDGTAECTGNGCGPTPTQIAQFVTALDTLDVMILSCVVDFGSRVSNVTQRQAFADFWTTRGYVGIHAITDSPGSWAPLDTIHGTRFRGHPPEQNGNIRRDSVFQNDSAWQYLNRGVLSNGTDTTFYEEWFYFTTSGTAIRAGGFLKPTMKLNEASIADPGSQTAMGDHPMSWYKRLPTGGRFFYTAVGHRSQVWQTTRFFRRQVYNAILWTAKYDSLAQTVSIDPRGTPSLSSGDSRLTISAGALTVSILKDGAHAVEVLSLDGRRIAARRGSDRMEHRFSNLQQGVHVIVVETKEGRTMRRVNMP